MIESSWCYDLSIGVVKIDVYIAISGKGMVASAVMMSGFSFS